MQTESHLQPPNARARYEVTVGSHVLTADTPHLSSTPIYAAGARVQVGIDPAELRLLP